MPASPSRWVTIPVLGTGMLAVSMGAVLVRLSQEAPSLTIAAWRMVFATLILLPFYLRERRNGVAGGWTRMHVLSGIALGLHFAFWISSVRYTSIAVSVLLVDTSPVVVAVLSRVFFGERLSRNGLIGLVLTIVGSFLLFRNDLETVGDWRGPALALAGAGAVAVYLMVGRRLRQDCPGLLAYVFPTYLTAAVLLLVLAPVLGSGLTGFSGGTWVFLLLLGLVPQSIGHTSYNWSLRYLPATLVATLTLAEPILASLLAWQLLGETPSKGMIPGGLMVGLGILMVTLSFTGRRRTSDRLPENG